VGHLPSIVQSELRELVICIDGALYEQSDGPVHNAERVNRTSIFGLLLNQIGGEHGPEALQGIEYTSILLLREFTSQLWCD
jgi:hypothetical protein